MPPKAAGTSAGPSTSWDRNSSRRPSAKANSAVRASTSCRREAFRLATSKMRPAITAVAWRAPPASTHDFSTAAKAPTMACNWASVSSRARSRLYRAASSGADSSVLRGDDVDGAGGEGFAAWSLSDGSTALEGPSPESASAPPPDITWFLPLRRRSNKASIFLIDRCSSGDGVPSSRDFDEYTLPVGDSGLHSHSSAKDTCFRVLLGVRSERPAVDGDSSWASFAGSAASWPASLRNAPAAKAAAASGKVRRGGGGPSRDRFG
mmetsp:Transcript_115697/g.332321  ORF Transcript_115697/g.332321 Transcript_115697/m.332321 type:complete len:264 (+) Transcript_115697:463-1254(+)